MSNKGSKDLAKYLDQNGDGKITEGLIHTRQVCYNLSFNVIFNIEDFLLLAHKNGINYADPIIKMAFKKADKNKNGVLEFEEALALIDKVLRKNKSSGGTKS